MDAKTKKPRRGRLERGHGGAVDEGAADAKAKNPNRG